MLIKYYLLFFFINFLICNENFYEKKLREILKFNENNYFKVNYKNTLDSKICLDLNKKNFVIKINNNIFCDLDNDFIFKLVLYHELFHALIILSGDFNQNINLYINNFLFDSIPNNNFGLVSYFQIESKDKEMQNFFDIQYALCSLAGIVGQKFFISNKNFILNKKERFYIKSLRCFRSSSEYPLDSEIGNDIKSAINFINKISNNYKKSFEFVTNILIKELEIFFLDYKVQKIIKKKVEELEKIIKKNNKIYKKNRNEYFYIKIEKDDLVDIYTKNLFKLKIKNIINNLIK